MRRHFLVPAILCFILFDHSARSQSHDTSRVLRPGVVHVKRIDATGPWQINVLTIDLKQPDLTIESARALDLYRGRERTSSIANRKNNSLAHVVAAINADFFSLETGENTNYQVAGGKIVDAFSAKTSPRSQFGMTMKGRPVIDRYSFVGSAFWCDGTRSDISGINYFRRRNGVTLFDSYAGKQTPVDSTGLGVRDRMLSSCGSRGDTLVYIVGGGVYVGGGAPVNASTVVISLVGESDVGRDISIGDTVKILYSFHPHPGELRTLVGGTPRIVRNGRNLTGDQENAEGTAIDFSSKRHPRTGVGFSQDSTVVYFITVDGRQQSSVGMTLPEFADLMISLGVSDGLNLDGGGSTTMMVEGAVVNSPSDAAGERPVGNCLLLVEHKTP